MLTLALKEQHRVSQTKSPVARKLHCPICHKTFVFDIPDQTDLLNQVEQHLCFTIPNLNPYTILVLTHSLERGELQNAVAV